MGPRASAGGNINSPTCVLRGNRLQWGHARPRVETHNGRGYRGTGVASMGPRASARGNGELITLDPVTASSLQWGHARPRVETTRHSGKSTTLTVCFNGATRVRAWKL